MLPHVSVWLKLMNILAAVSLLILPDDGELAGSKLTRQKKVHSFCLILQSKPGQSTPVVAVAM